MQKVSIEDLKKVVALEGLPEKHLQWILDHSDYVEYSDGDIIAKYGEPAEAMWIALEGKVAFYMYVNGRQVYYFTFDNNNITGGVGGLLPYSRMKTFPGYSYAQGEVKTLRMNKKYFTELEALNPEFIQRLIGYMTERARAFATTQLQYEKVNALGNLAAGIAHELNNPAAAIGEISNELARRINRNEELTKDLLTYNIAADHFQQIREVVAEKEKSQSQKAKQSTLQRMASEDEIEDWLEKNGITRREIAETFAEFGLLTPDLEEILSRTGANSFSRLVPWLENLISCRKIIKDLGEASGHISNLVSSIKSHVHMDRANDLQLANIHQGIESALTLLGFKLREKNITVTKNFSPHLPEVPVFVGELNQVWTNIIDNAIFALDKNGKLDVDTSFDLNNITVSIIDNGKGIPQDIVSRIFDPFFTTKKVGEGTGIGLDIVNRIVNRHNGTIKVDSNPGRTEFSVCIPIVQKP